MTHIHAIETRYKGHRFRSRLEARWAVFFDALGIAWEYEREGYDLDGLAYLPDFWLPRQQIWAEVKPETPDQEEREKAERLAMATRHRVVMLFDIPQRRPLVAPGDPAGLLLMPTLWGWQYINPPEEGARAWVLVDDGGLLWTRCPVCGYVDVTLWGANDHLACRCLTFDSERAAQYGARRFNSESPELLAAYEAAHSADFGRRGRGARR